eukprot:202643_1
MTLRSKTDNCIAMASHISSIGELHLLPKCLESLINQTIQTDIFVSISFSNKKYKKQFHDTIHRNYIDKIHWKIQSSQKFQMMHYKILTPYIIKKKYQLIFF